jgi:hypothetical protein
MKIVILVLMLPFLIPIVLAIIFIIKIIVKGKNEAWTGTVIDKNHTTKQDDEFKNKINHFYSLKIKMKEGRERNIAVSSEFWNSNNFISSKVSLKYKTDTVLRQLK